MFHTWETYKDCKQKEVALLYRKKIEQYLMYLHESVKPIAREFELYYSLFTEGHPSIVGYAFTKKIKVLISSPLEKNKEYLTTYHVYIKLRDPTKPNDSKLFLNKTTSMAIMLHELAHLRCYDHSFNFALLLRDIYKSAMKLNLFPNEKEEHMIPSRRSWEQVLFSKKGNMTDEELKEVYDEFINNQGNNELLDDSLIQEDNLTDKQNRQQKENKQVDIQQECSHCNQNNQLLNQNMEDSKMEIEEEQVEHNNRPRVNSEAINKQIRIPKILKDKTNSQKGLQVNNKNSTANQNPKQNNTLLKLPLLKQKSQLVQNKVENEKITSNQIQKSKYLPSKYIPISQQSARAKPVLKTVTTITKILKKQTLEEENDKV